MLDLDTYLLTKDNPGGPLLVMEPMPTEEDNFEPVTLGVAIGRILGLALVLALGIYSYYAI